MIVGIPLLRGIRWKGGPTALDLPPGNILSNMLRKRLKTLGYPSLRRFHADRPGLGLSYEVLRQVVYTGRVPRPETLFRILGSMQFSSSQIQKICGMHYGDYLPISPPVPVQSSAPSPARETATGERPPAGDETGRTDRGRTEQEAAGVFPDDPGELLLSRAGRGYTTPWASMASATFTKPAMVAPFT